MARLVKLEVWGQVYGRGQEIIYLLLIMGYQTISGHLVQDRLRWWKGLIGKGGQ